MILQDERVKLEPLTMEHFAPLLQIATENSQLFDHVPSAPNTAEKMQKYMLSALNGTQKGEQQAFVVIDKNSNDIVGSTRFYEIEPHNRTLKIGYTWLAPKAQGTGINKRMKFLMLQHAFETLGVVRVGFTADIANQQSIHAMQSIGATLEGVMRSERLLHTGKRRDTAVLSILVDEWESGVKAMLKGKIGQ